MTFLAPWMFLGVLAAAIPIALHFFYRSRYRTLPWAAMEFLLASIEQTSRRLKFQELLLLLARIAVLVLLALALMRPAFTASAGAGQGDAVDAFFIIDNSFSMAAKDGETTRFERAKTAAQAIIDQLPPHSTVQIITVADRAALHGPRNSGNLDQAKHIIDKMQTTSLATDLLPGVTEAASLLPRGQSPNKEVYLFSDMQQLGWDAQASALVEKLREIRRQAPVYLVRCGTRTPRNIAIVGIVPQSAIPHTGERADFAVLVRNSGKDAVRDLTVSLEVDGKTKERDSRPIPEIPRQQTVAVMLTGKLEKAGLRTVTATVGPDELEADNRFDLLLPVREQVRVLVVDGQPSERDPEKASSYYLMHGLRPVPERRWGDYHIQPRLTTPALASASLLADKDLCILANVPLARRAGADAGVLSPEFLEKLGEFVRSGKGLLVFCGPQTDPAAYNRVLEKHGLLPAKLSGPLVNQADKPLRLDPASIETPSALAKFRDEPLRQIGEVDILQALGADDPASGGRKPPEAQNSSRVLLRYTNRRPAVISKKVGDGEVLLVTTSADPRWTDWPYFPTYVPFVHSVLGRLLAGQTTEHNHVAGQPLRWHPPASEATRPFALVRPNHERVRLGLPQPVDGRPTVTTADTFRAGIYRIVPADAEWSEEDAARSKQPAVPFAVVPDLRESDNLQTLSDTLIDERLGPGFVHITAGEESNATLGAERLNREWTVWLLAAVLAFALVETVLAWFCGRAW